MSFRPPSLRTPRPRSPVRRGYVWPCGREFFVLLGLAVFMMVVLLAFSESALAVTLRRLTGFLDAAEKDDAVASPKRLPGICLHAGIDRSLTPRVEDLLKTAGIVSIADKLALSCHLSVSELSVPVPASYIAEVERAFPHRVCCVDFDVIVASDGTPVVTRPEQLAPLLIQRRSGTIDAAEPGNDALQATIQEILHGHVSLKEIVEADPAHQRAQSLADIAAVVARVLTTQSPSDSLLNATRFTLEPKVSDAPARLASGNAPLPLKDVVQHIATVLSDAGKKTESKGYALWEYFGIVVDPLWFTSSWKELMGAPSQVFNNRQTSTTVGMSQGFSVLATSPQLWYVMPLKDVVLTELAQRSDASTGTYHFSVNAAATSGPPGTLQRNWIEHRDALSAQSYCSMLLAPPQWVRELAPSVGLLQRCVKWFEPRVHPKVVGGVYDVSLQARKKKGTSDDEGDNMVSVKSTSVGKTPWSKVMQILYGSSATSLPPPTQLISTSRRNVSKVSPAHIPFEHIHSRKLLTWIVDDLDTYIRVVRFGKREGLRSAFVISNMAQKLSADVHDYFGR